MFYKHLARAKSAWASLSATIALTATVILLTLGGDSAPIAAQSNDEYPPVKNCPGGALSGRTRDIVEHVEAVTGKACAGIVAADLGTIIHLDFSGNGWKQLRPNDFFGFTDLQTLNLSNNQITEIPENAFYIGDPADPTVTPDINILKLQNNKISTIHPDAFQNLTGALTQVDLNNNSLTTLPNGLFRGIRALRSVNISSNFIDQLPSGIFSGLNDLRTLSAGNNYLTSDRLGFLANTNFWNLTLNNNRITSDGAGPMPDLPSDVFADLTQLETLALQENAISELPTRIFSGLTELQFIRLDGNRFTTLQDGLFNGLTSLDTVQLQLNRIESLPAGLLDGRTTLCRIWLHNNKIESLPAGFFSDFTLTTSLQLGAATCEARLYDNEFTPAEQTRLTTLLGARADFTAPPSPPSKPAIPADADDAETLANCGTGPLNGRTQKVASLIFDAIPTSVTTPLTGLPADDPTNCSAITTEHLTLVTSLTLSGSITSFQADDFADLPNLETLNFHPTTPPHVTNLPAGLFNGLNKVHSMSLSGSWIQTLPRSIFNDLTNLKSLTLSNNLLSTLPSGIFRNLANLRILFLQQNQLNSLPAGLFAGLDELQILGLTNNQLRQSDFTANTFQGLNNLRSLYLENNNFRWLYVDRFTRQGLNRLTRLTVAPASDLPTDSEWLQFRAQLPSVTYIRFQPGNNVAEFAATPTPVQTVTPTLEERLELPLMTKIEPSARSLTVAVSTEIRLSIALYDLQNVRLDSLADTPWLNIVWDGPEGGSFSEPRRGQTDADGRPDDRVVQWRTPDLPGKHTVSATVMPAWACGGNEFDCTATFNINTIRSAAEPTPEPTPCPTTGLVPTSITDTDGNAYSTITPAEGGEFLSDSATITVPTGALAGCNPIGIRSFALTGDSQTTFVGWTTAGNRYRIEVADINGTKLSNLVMRNPATICVPLPTQFRASLSGITLLRDNGNGAFTQLTSSIRLREATGATLCGNVSTFPADVVAGGPTAATTSEPPSPTPEAGTPDAGATSPTSAYVLLALILGAIAVLGAMRILDARRPV